MLQLPDTYIIYGANSAIGSQLLKLFLPHVERLIGFYHKNKDRIEGVIDISPSNTREKVSPPLKSTTPSRITPLYPPLVRGVATPLIATSQAPRNDEKGNITLYQSDITDFDNLLEKMSDINQRFKINNLSLVFFPAIRSYDGQPLLNTSLDITKEIIDVNLMGAIHFLKATINAFSNVKSKRYVLLGSNVSKHGLPNGSVYAATKAAIVNLVKTIAKEEGKNNTLINVVSPGPVETDSSGFSDVYSRFRTEYFQAQKALTSTGNLASIDDVCNLIVYLSSLENKHITGEEIFIDGGV